MSDEILTLDDGLRHLSRLVLQDETLETTLQRIVDVATRAVPDTLGVSITLQKGTRPYTAVATNPAVEAIDQREYAVDEGPCIDAIRTGRPHLLDDVATETRWPAFTGVCRDEGLGSVLGVPLCVGDEPYGAMNLYALSPGAFKEDQQQAAALLAEQAGVALANTRTYSACSDKIRQLQEALETRVIIEQAKGVLMATERCDAEAAFEILKTRSQRTNTKLRKVADDVVDGLLSSF
jgi:GAF domain-containing protein